MSRLVDLLKEVMMGKAGMGGGTQGLFGTGGQTGNGVVNPRKSLLNLGQGFNKMNSQPGGLLGNIPQSALLGSALFGQGMQGKDPFSALLPAVTQTAQLQKYMTPELKKPNLINMIGGDQKTPITLNLSNKEDLQKFRELKSQGFYEVGKPGVQAPSLEGISGVPKATLTEAGKKLLGAEELQVTLSSMENLFEPEFLTYAGKGKKFLSDTLSKAGYSNEQIDSFAQRKAVWDQSVEQYFNQYRKLITGVAAGEKEIGFLEKSIPSKGDAPNVFLSKVRLQQKLNNKIIERSKRYLQGGGVKTLDKDGKPTGAFKNYLEKNPIQVERDDVLSITQEYKNMGYQPKQIEFQLNQQFGNEWKKFFE